MPVSARDLRLELEQILQRALRDLGLVGRVAGQELRALDQVIDASPAHGACRRRRRRRTAPTTPATFLAAMAAEQALDLELALARAAGRAGPAAELVGRHVGEEVVDARRRRSRASISPRSAVGEGQIAHGSLRPSDFTKSWYCGLGPSGRRARSGRRRLSLTNQPLPAGSSLTVAGRAFELAVDRDDLAGDGA